ncbi:hypothetical protein [Luteimonas abyssi]|uniref:hypothetical protein n=1 Tax=Luteimonas abyssi TaxID=1247514 RepID=UPI000AB67665|nr:hypothetical protein [Luteimonas abyssi]
MAVNEKWVIYTVSDTQFLFDLHQVSRVENQLREEGQKYRTIYYRDNKPTKYVIGEGYQIMDREEVAAIIESVQPDQSLSCAHCGEYLTEHTIIYRAGNNGTEFCSKSCAYEAFEGLYNKQQVDRTLIKKEVK